MTAEEKKQIFINSNSAITTQDCKRLDELLDLVCTEQREICKKATAGIGISVMKAYKLKQAIGNAPKPKF